MYVRLSRLVWLAGVPALILGFAAIQATAQCTVTWQCTYASHDTTQCGANPPLTESIPKFYSTLSECQTAPNPCMTLNHGGGGCDHPLTSSKITSPCSCNGVQAGPPPPPPVPSPTPGNFAAPRRPVAPSPTPTQTGNAGTPKASGSVTGPQSGRSVFNAHPSMDFANWKMDLDTYHKNNLALWRGLVLSKNPPPDPSAGKAEFQRWWDRFVKTAPPDIYAELRQFVPTREQANYSNLYNAYRDQMSKDKCYHLGCAGVQAPGGAASGAQGQGTATTGATTGAGGGGAGAGGVGAGAGVGTGPSIGGKGGGGATGAGTASGIAGSGTGGGAVTGTGSGQAAQTGGAGVPSSLGNTGAAGQLKGMPGASDATGSQESQSQAAGGGFDNAAGGKSGQSGGESGGQSNPIDRIKQADQLFPLDEQKATPSGPQTEIQNVNGVPVKDDKGYVIGSDGKGNDVRSKDGKYYYYNNGGYTPIPEQGPGGGKQFGGGRGPGPGRPGPGTYTPPPLNTPTPTEQGVHEVTAGPIDGSGGQPVDASPGVRQGAPDKPPPPNPAPGPSRGGGAPPNQGGKQGQPTPAPGSGQPGTGQPGAPPPAKGAPPGKYVPPPPDLAPPPAVKPPSGPAKAPTAGPPPAQTQPPVEQKPPQPDQKQPPPDGRKRRLRPLPVRPKPLRPPAQPSEPGQPAPNQPSLSQPPPNQPKSTTGTSGDSGAP